MDKKRADIAEELFMGGANCAQAVLGAFADVINIDFETAMKLSSPFGGGVARMREICGAISGASMAIGLLRGFGATPEQEDRKNLYALVTRVADEFKALNGSYICGELLGVKRSSPEPTPRTPGFYHARPCIKYVRDAVELTEKALFGK